MITYNKGVPEIFAEAAADKSAGWTKTQKINLLQLADLISDDAANGKTNIGVVG